MVGYVFSLTFLLAILLIFFLPIPLHSMLIQIRFYCHDHYLLLLLLCWIPDPLHTELIPFMSVTKRVVSTTVNASTISTTPINKVLPIFPLSSPLGLKHGSDKGINHVII